MPNIGETFTHPYQHAEKISADPAYRRIVCFCESVSPKAKSETPATR
jgi:glycerol-3-phosphate dehydrogenase